MAALLHGSAARYRKGCRCDVCVTSGPNAIREERRRAYLKNAEAYKLRTRLWRERNPERKKASDKRRYESTRDAARWLKRLKYYGVTKDEWESRFRDNNFSCAICKSPDPKGNGWSTDHDHETGMFRDIICSPCNTALGLAREEPTILAAMIAYLQKHKR